MPVDGEPLNGVYLIDPDGACQWDSIALEGAFVEFLINFSRVVGTTSEFALCFRGLAFDSCASFFVNDLNPLVDFFFDGTCEILA
ncbi:MAG: hypothetical protein KAJ07_09115 [Planctomycetes bacterium]|nr:hypothetical protein [Planctomycetota bacterium]